MAKIVEGPSDKERTKQRIEKVKVAKARPGTRLTKDGHRRTFMTKYSKAVHKKVVAEIKKGVSLMDAGLLAGLGKETVDSWIYYGRHEPEKYPEYAQLAKDIEEARAHRRGELADRIVKTGMSGQPGTWQAAAWYLERTDPENWGRKDRIEHSGDSPKVQLNTVVLLDQDAREAARNLLSRVAGNASPDISIGPGSGVQLEEGADS